MKKIEFKKIYLILGTIISLLVIFLLIILILERVEIKFKALTFAEAGCKKDLIKKLDFDTNVYIKDLNYEGISGRWGMTGKEIAIDVIAYLTSTSKEDVRRIVRDEYDKSRKPGWEQMNPLKIKDLVGETVDWNSVDFKNPKLLEYFCMQRPEFIKLRK